MKKDLPIYLKASASDGVIVTSVNDVIEFNKSDSINRMPYGQKLFEGIIADQGTIQDLEAIKSKLKKNGQIAILFSNRLFLSKAIGLWTGSDDVDHAYTVGSYLHFGGFTEIKAEDLSTRKQKGKEQVIVGDPLYVVTGMKS